MAIQVDNKFTWVISNFSSSLQSEVIYSDNFTVGGCKWCLSAYPKGLMEPGGFDMLVEVANYVSLPPGWRRLARFNLTIVNQNLGNNIQLKESVSWFDQDIPMWSSEPMLPLTKLVASDGGFLVNDEIKIVVEIDVIEVIGNLDVSQVATRPLKKTKLDVHGPMSSDLLKATINVYGFQVLPSQVESVRRIFEKHPNIASGFRAKNQHLRTACMNVLLSLTAILRQLPREISKDDLANAYVLLGSLKDAGFKVDWLEKKVNEVSEKKQKEKACKTRMQEIQTEWKDLKAKVSDARAPLKLDDVV